MQGSPALVRFFLFCTACQLCYSSKEIGDMAFEMLSRIGLIEETAVSSKQIASLVAHFAGHCNNLVPADDLYAMANKIMNVEPELLKFSRFGYRELARLLIDLFVALQDTSTTTVRIYARAQGVWLCTMLTWLLEDDIFINSSFGPIAGSNNARIVVDLDAEELSYTMVIVKEHKHSTSCVYPFTIKGLSFGHIPLRSTMPFVIQNLCKSTYGQHSWARRASQLVLGFIDVSSIMVKALADFLLHKGRLRSTAAHNGGLRRITGNPDLPASTIERYGWEQLYMAQLQEAENLSEELCRAFNRSPRGPEMRFQPAWLWLSSLLEPTCRALMQSHGIYDFLLESDTHANLMHAAVAIAVDAVLTSIVETTTGCHRFISSEYIMESKSAYDIMKTMLVGTMELRDFIGHAVQQVLPSLPRFGRQDLVSQSEGCVAGFAAIWDSEDARLNTAMIRLATGHIYKDGHFYNCITEIGGSLFDEARYNLVQYFDTSTLDKRCRKIIKLSRGGKKCKMSTIIGFAESTIGVRYQLINLPPVHPFDLAEETLNFRRCLERLAMTRRARDMSPGLAFRESGSDSPRSVASEMMDFIESVRGIDGEPHMPNEDFLDALDGHSL